MKFFKKIVGDRIYLSPKNASEDEIEQFTEWMNDPEVTYYTGRIAQLITIDSETDYLKAVERDSSGYHFNIVDLKEDRLIGVVSLEHVKWVDRRAMLGIFIGDKDFRSNGYGTEAIRLVLEYAFRYLNLHSVWLDLLEGNERAHTCYKKCGFRDSGCTREAIFLDGKYHGMMHMDILEDEFKGEYIRNLRI